MAVPYFEKALFANEEGRTCVEGEVLLQTEPLKTVVVDARVRDAGVGKT